jgi:hypothetical protein
MGVCAKGGNTLATNVAFQTRSLHLRRSCRVPSVRCSSANAFPVQQVPLYSASPSGYKEHKGSLHGVVIPCLSGEGLSIDQLLSREDAVAPSSGADPENAFEVFEGCEFKVPFHQAFHEASGHVQIRSEESNEGTMTGATEANHLAEERAALEAAFHAPDSLQSHLLTLPPSTTRNFHTEEPQPLGTLQQVHNMFLGTAKLLGAIVLAATLALCSPHPAMAARSMGRAGGGGFSSSRSSSSRGSSSHSSSSHGSSGRSSSSLGSSSRSSSSHGSSGRSSSSHGSSSRSSSSGSSSHSSSSSGGSPSRSSYSSSHSSRPSSSTWSSSLSSSPSVSSWSSESTTTWASPSPSYHRSKSSRRLANTIIEGLFGDGSPNRAQSQATWQKQEQGTEQPRPNVAAGETTKAGKTAEADKTAKADETKEADETSEWLYWLVGLVLFVSLLCVLKGLMTEDHGARRWGEKVGVSGDDMKDPLAASGVYMSDADMRNVITIVKIQVRKKASLYKCPPSCCLWMCLNYKKCIHQQ